MDLVGHSYAVPLGVEDSKGAAQLYAAHLGVELSNYAHTGAELHSSNVVGGYSTIANMLTRDSATYERAVANGFLWYGGDDLFTMGSPFGPSSEAHLKSCFRFGISRMCAGKVFDDDDESIAYSGFLESTELGEQKVTGKTNHYSTTNGSTVTISVPSDFPGGTVAIYLGAIDGGGATWTFTVDGEEDEDTLSTAYDYGFENVLSMFCRRYTGLAAGDHTIELAATDINTYAFFDSWAVEAVEPPRVIVPGQFTLQTYDEGETHTPDDADIEALEKLQQEACEEFGSSVIFVSLASMNKTDNVQEDGIHPTVAGHQEIYELILAALPEEEAEEIVGHMDYGFMRDDKRRLIVVPDAEGVMDQGFLRDEDRNLAVVLEGEGSMDYGFVRDSKRRLVVVEGEIDHFDQGLPRDAEGRLVVSKEEGNRFDQGFLRDSEGRIVVAGLS